MAEAFRCVCLTCGWESDPCTGTVYNDARLQAGKAKGGHVNANPGHDVEVVSDG